MAILLRSSPRCFSASARRRSASTSLSYSSCNKVRAAEGIGRPSAKGLCARCACASPNPCNAASHPLCQRPSGPPGEQSSLERSAYLLAAADTSTHCCGSLDQALLLDLGLVLGDVLAGSDLHLVCGLDVTQLGILVQLLLLQHSRHRCFQNHGPEMRVAKLVPSAKLAKCYLLSSYA